MKFTKKITVKNPVSERFYDEEVPDVLKIANHINKLIARHGNPLGKDCSIYGTFRHQEIFAFDLTVFAKDAKNDCLSFYDFDMIATLNAKMLIVDALFSGKFKKFEDFKAAIIGM